MFDQIQTSRIWKPGEFFKEKWAFSLNFDTFCMSEKKSPL